MHLTIGWFSCQTYRTNTLRPNQANKAFDVLKQKFYCAGGRKNVGQDYRGVGMQIYPPKKAKSPGEAHRDYNADRVPPIHLITASAGVQIRQYQI